MSHTNPTVTQPQMQLVLVLDQYYEFKELRIEGSSVANGKPLTASIVNSHPASSKVWADCLMLLIVSWRYTCSNPRSGLRIQFDRSSCRGESLKRTAERRFRLSQNDYLLNFFESYISRSSREHPSCLLARQFGAFFKIGESHLVSALPHDHSPVRVLVYEQENEREPTQEDAEIIGDRWLSDVELAPTNSAQETCMLFKDSDAAYEDMKTRVADLDEGEATIIQFTSLKAMPAISFLFGKRKFKIHLFLSDFGHKDEKSEEGYKYQIHFFKNHLAALVDKDYAGDITVYRYPFAQVALRLVWVHGLGVYYGHYRKRSKKPFLVWGHEDPMIFLSENHPEFDAFRAVIQSVIDEDLTPSSGPDFRASDHYGQSKIAQANTTTN